LSIKVEIDGLDEALATLDLLESEGFMLSITDAPLDVVVADGFVYLQNIAPVDTGYLRSQLIPEKPDEFTHTITSRAPYSYFVEVGHLTRSGSFVPGQFFMLRTRDHIIGTINSSEFIEMAVGELVIRIV